MGAALGWIFVRLPRRLLMAVFGGLGVLAWWLGLRRKVILSNLRLAFPEKSEAERRAIGKACLRHLGEMIPEFLRVPYLPRADIERIFEYDGWENFLAAQAEGKGVIACTAHFGHFDLLAAAHNLRGVPMTTISRKMQIGLWKGTRARAGVQEIYVDRGDTVRAATQALRAGRVLGYVIDQSEPNRNAIYPRFFGVPVATAATPAVLSRRTGAPVVFTLSVPLPGGRHKVVIQGPLRPPDTGDREADATAFLQDLNDRLESWIRRHPEQWYWLHRRWKRRRDLPAAEPPRSLTGQDPAR